MNVRSRRTSRRVAALVSAAALLGPLGASAAAAAPTAVHQATTSPAGSYVVRARAGQLPAVRAAVLAAGGHVDRTLGLIGGLSATLPAGAAAALRQNGRVLEVTGNAAVHLMASGSYTPSNDTNSAFALEQTIGARALWSKGFTGKGIDVALVDSGVAPVAGLGTVVHGPDLTPESQNPATRNLDTYGHGTHLAGLINGRDAAAAGESPNALSSDKTNFLGVAPDARVVSVKAGDAHGNTDISQVIAGIDWVVQHAKDNGMNIRVLNLSYGTDSGQAYQLDPLTYAAEQAWKRGIVVVVSAGNSGATNGRLTDPAVDPYVIAVGADDSQGSPSVNDDTIPAFSSRGDGVRNPDLVAPGAHLQSLRVPGSYIDAQYGSTGAINDRFMRGSGTSQAAAVTSGSVALLLQQYPGLKPDQVKGMLVANAANLPAADPQAQGAGLLSLIGTTQTLAGQNLVQSFVAATGLGSLEAARGNHHLVLGGVTLQGEVDLMGRPFSTATMAGLELTGSAWAGGTWNGSAWAGSAWAGSAWAGNAWAGSAWNGSAWAGSAWATGSWSGSAWANGSWNGSAWAGSAWAGSAWAGHAWADDSWS